MDACAPACSLDALRSSISNSNIIKNVEGEKKKGKNVAGAGGEAAAAAGSGVVTRALFFFLFSLELFVRLFVDSTNVSMVTL